MGDTYEWFPRKAVQNGGRPEGGNTKGEGYTECPKCEKDFHVKVVVENDTIIGAEPDATKAPFIPD